MKKNLIFLILFSAIFIPVFCSAFGELPVTTGTTISDLFKNILDVVWIVFTGLAVILFVFAGIMFLTAQGDPTKLTTAKNAFLWGVVGVVVAILAFSIVAIIQTAIT